MDLRRRDFIWEIFEIELEISRDRTTQADGKYCQYLDLPPCLLRILDIRRALDRPEPPTGPLTAPRSARPPLCSWPIWTGKSVFRWLKSTLHYLPRLFPTPPSSKRAGLSPASPGSRPNLSGGARARRGARARPVSRGAAFPSRFLKKMLSWKARSARKSPLFAARAGIVTNPSELPCLTN